MRKTPKDNKPLPPDQFCLDGFEECLDGRIIIAVTFA